MGQNDFKRESLFDRIQIISRFAYVKIVSSFILDDAQFYRKSEVI